MYNLKNHINQTKLDFSCDAGAASVNVYTGRLLFQRLDLSMGANSSIVSVSHVYDSQACDEINTHMGNGWRLNIQQYIVRSGEKDANKQNLYLYIDGNGYIHQFEKYDDNDDAAKYFDRTGSGLVLWMKSNERYIEDALGGKMYFDFNQTEGSGKLIEMVSVADPPIRKKIEYDDCGRVASIYDQSKSENKITFTYGTSGLLSHMKYVEDETTTFKISYTYDENGNIVSIQEIESEAMRYTVLYGYTDENRLKYAIRVESNSSIKQGYDDDGRVVEISNGLIKTEFKYSETRPAIFTSDYVSSGGINYCGQSERKFLGFGLTEVGDTMTESEDSDIVYENYFTSVTNGKGTVIDYYFNAYGFTTQVFERVGGNENNLKTITASSGELLLAGGTGVKINGKKSFTITPSETEYKLPIDMVSGYIFSEEHKTIKRYAVSFLLKINEELTSDVKVTLTAHFKTNGKIKPCSFTNILDASAVQAWQRVTVLADFTFDENSALSLMSLKFSGLSNNAEIADLRICPDQSTEFRVGLADSFSSVFPILSTPLNNITDITYYIGGEPVSNTVGSKFFMSEDDVISTCYNMKYKNETGGVFDLVACNGMRKISKIQQIKMTALSIGQLVLNSYKHMYYAPDKTITVETNYEFTSNGIKQTAVTDFDNNPNSTEYVTLNRRGSIIEKTDRFNEKTEFKYNSAGEATRVHIGNDNLFTAEYYDRGCHIAHKMPEWIDGYREFWIDGGFLEKETVRGHMFIYNYYARELIGFSCDGVKYTYVKNYKGDILEVLDSNENIVASYQYGNVDGSHTVTNGNGVKIYDSSSGVVEGAEEAIGNLNPFRYRGLYWDYMSERYVHFSEQAKRYCDPNEGTYINFAKDLLPGQVDWLCSMGVKTDWYIFVETVSVPMEKISQQGLIPHSIVLGVLVVTCNPLLGYLALGVYHMFGFKQENGVYYTEGGVQKYFGYCDVYDAVFKVFCDMDKDKFEFTYNNQRYILWAWKADYLNLGAGAELGIYRHFALDWWAADEALSQKMTLRLKYKGVEIIRRTAKTWWITGFNSNYQKARPSELEAIITVNFNTGSGDNELARNRGLYQAFRNDWLTKTQTKGKWTFYDNTYTAILSWPG